MVCVHLLRSNSQANNQHGVVLQRVPFNKEKVNKQAMEYAGQRLSLSIPCCGFLYWDECYDRLAGAKRSTVILTPEFRPDQDLPGWQTVTVSFRTGGGRIALDAAATASVYRMAGHQC
jgi:hypothetical protein